MKRLLATTVFALAALPAFAMSDTMSCKDFTAMDAGGQMKTVEEMHAMMGSGGMKSGEMKSSEMKSGDTGGAMTSGGAMSSDTEAMTRQVAAACEASPDMMIGDAMNKATMK